MSYARHLVLAGAAVLCIGTAFAATPPFTLTEDGSAFIYPARPGDMPSTVAAMFGIAAEDLPAFLAANGIEDSTRVPTGHVYRIPNPLATRAERAESQAQALGWEAAGLRARADTLERELATAREAGAEAEQRAEHAARFARLWWIGVGIAGLLVVGIGIALAVAVNAVRMRQRAEHYGRTLGDELEEKRRRGLVERQEAAKRILDLETQLDGVKLKREPPPTTLGRRSPAAR